MRDKEMRVSRVMEKGHRRGPTKCSKCCILLYVLFYSFDLLEKCHFCMDFLAIHFICNAIFVFPLK